MKLLECIPVIKNDIRSEQTKIMDIFNTNEIYLDDNNYKNKQDFYINGYKRLLFDKINKKENKTYQDSDFKNGFTVITVNQFIRKFINKE